MYSIYYFHTLHNYNYSFNRIFKTSYLLFNVEKLIFNILRMCKTNEIRKRILFIYSSTK
jgi:hypothetical protein